jgi:tetratricopeptide (TPR) repeat protein
MKQHRKSKRPRPARLIALSLIVLGIATAGIVFWTTRKPTLPVVALETLEPTAAGVVDRHLNAVRAAPRSGTAWGQLGAVLRLYEFRREAAHCFTVAAGLDPKNPRWLHLHGTMIAGRSPTEAIPLLRRAAALSGNSPEVSRLKLVALLMENGQPDEARREINELLREQPNHALGLMLLARLEQARGDAPSVLALTARCTNDIRTARAAWLLRSAAHQAVGDSSAARAAAEKADRLPSDAPLHDPFEAETLSMRTDPRSLSDRAQVLLRSGQVTEARPLIEQLAREHPGFAETWLLTGRLRLLQRRPAEAEISLRRYLAQEPRSANGHFQLGMAMMEQQKFKEAIEPFTTATRLKPDLAPAYFNLGVALVKADRKPEAVAPFREAIRHSPERVDSYILLADLHLQLGQRDEAIILARKAESLAPDDRRLPHLWRKIGGN